MKLLQSLYSRWNSSTEQLSEFTKARLFRVLLISPFLGISSLVSGSSETLNYPVWLITLIPFCYFLLSLSALFYLANRKYKPFDLAEIFIEVLATTWAVLLTGGPQSPLLFLYLPLVMEAAVLHSRKVALTVSALATSIHAVISYALLSGYISSPDSLLSLEPPRGGILVQSLGLISGMVLVAILVSFLVKSLIQSRASEAQSKKDLHELTTRQSELMNELPEGVIATNLEESIININEAAATLLQISQNELQGRPIAEALKAINADVELRGGLLAGQRELKLKRPGSQDLIHVIFRCRPMVNNAGEPVGTVYLLQDVTKLRAVEEQLQMQEHMSRVLSSERKYQDSNSPYLEGLVGETAAMRQISKLVEKVAITDATVLVMGESGTGKELVARGIHNASNRSSMPFIAVNCGAIPENLIESELFGHKRGSFTGAEHDHPGLFQQAQGGTIFLDEIAELPLNMQSKLLRVLQERKVHPIGSTSDISVDLRIISATNRNLKEEVSKGRFREDLYYRLNVVSIQLPALRERREDIPLLIGAVLKRHLGGTDEAMVSPQAMQLLLRYGYPGNVRELENILERALVLGGSIILPEHLPDAVQNYQHPKEKLETQIVVLDDIKFPISLDELLGQIEHRYLEAALKQSGGAKKRAAELLGVNFRSFRYRLQKHNL